MRKKGFTLIEVMVYLSVGTLLLTLVIGTIFTLVSFRKEYTKTAINEDRFINGMMAISSRLNKGQLSSVDVEDDKAIVINENENKKSKITLYDNSDIAVCYYDGNRLLTVNKIITGVDDFEVTKKQNLIYIKINIEGSNYEEVFKI